MSNELAVNYLGLQLTSPVVMGACPLTIQPETVRQLVDAGVGAVVLPSMLQEQIVHRQLKSTDPLRAISDSGYQSQQDKYNGGADNYPGIIANLKRVTCIPIIASMNCASKGDWLAYAEEIESAGADALELNVQSAIYDPHTTAATIESDLCEMVADLVSRISIPVTVKVSQRYTNLASITRQIRDVGAKGIVLFTHLPHWDVSLDRKHWTIAWELSPIDSLGGILEGIVRVYNANLNLSIAASGGVSNSDEAIKAMIAGADVVMVTSAVYREGPNAIRSIVDGIRRHLEINHYPTISDFQHSRPAAEIGPERIMRLQVTDPLTRSTTYFDPTPVVSPETGDAFGHKT
ncbi:dihydroorotate dehydrogenase-like protein [Rubripirellula reticaptiva]|uniref:Dihydroorotate dehydrogenase B (NAD(+)), catalytic subunit n=1 Tax=Rubripirellula reticaptiva TaxID=2528013 RepID=A0A5C6ECG4_9BACT|nr:dihydroorotate dehydrogenase-like protein [Rubripirellula reticaptiva]TWU46692.1 Dihydroorotate dehydrogenase B (NAD(+)), catalytic subunit [Rubripirellula reticaptiva]